MIGLVITTCCYEHATFLVSVLPDKFTHSYHHPPSEGYPIKQNRKSTS